MTSAVLTQGPAPIDARCAGLSLLLRAVLTMQSAGIKAITLVVEDTAKARSILDDPRVRIPVSLASVAPEGASTSLDVMASAARWRAVVAGGRSVDDDALPGFRVFVGDEAGRRRATRWLFEDCRKPLDGIVSRHLNRHVSIFVSKRLVDTRISPNATTLIAFSLGIAGAALVTRGTHLAIVAGAALFQLGSILDGVDGELARVRFEQSRVGQWLDTVLDDVANVVFWLCLGLGAPRWLLPFAIVASSANLLAALLSYFELLRVGSGDWYDLGWDVRKTRGPGWLQRIVVFAGHVLKKDFFIFFCLCLAIAGVLPYALPLLAVGAVVTLGSALLRSMRAHGARAPS
jgi:phosphatidylglycerophosphate synthase